MKLITVGSSSTGNCHILECDGSQLMLDCGVKHERILKNVDLSMLKAILVTHGHGDHTRGIKELIKYLDSSVNVYSNDATLDLLKIPHNRKVVFEEQKAITIDVWQVIPFEVMHDVKNCNYLIKHKGTGSVISYITDTGFLDNIELDNVDYFIIECNHRETHLEEMIKLDEETYGPRYKRVLSKFGHIGLQKCIDFLDKNCGINTKKVLLCHITKNGYVKDLFRNEVAARFPDVEVIELVPTESSEPQITVLKKELIDFSSL